MEVFIENCERLQKRQSRKEVADTTVLLDWSDADLKQLGTLTAEFHGNAPHNEPVEVLKPEFFIQRNPRVYPESFINEYSRKESICSTSWATSIIEVAEASLNNQYELSVNQLIQCLPTYFDMENSCNGFEPSLIRTYLKEVGLVQNNDFVNCDSLDKNTKFKFDYILP